MEYEKKYTLVIPDTAESPLKRGEVELTILVEPKEVLQKELEVNTVHPLEAEVAEYEAVGRNDGKYEAKPIIKTGVIFLMSLNIITMLAGIIAISDMLAAEEHISDIDKIFWLLAFMLVSVIFYYEFSYLNKIYKSKSGKK